MSTQSEQHGSGHGTAATAHHEDHAAGDRKLSYAILVMLSLLGVLFGIVVPASIVLLHSAMGY